MKITNNLAKLMLLSASMVLSQQGAAVPIDPEGQPLGFIGPMELSTTDLSNGAKGYRGWFENGGWQGDLIEYDVTNTGGISTSIDLTGPSPQLGAGGANWSAHVNFAATADTTSHWNTGRKIIFSNSYGGNQKAFRWENLDVYQKAALDNLTAVEATGNPSPVLNYLRGDRINEGVAGSMRSRFTVLGDIIHSNPVYVGAPRESFTDSAYVTFKNDNINRSPRVYIGANDGMLHAFNATNGQEEWAYVPSMLIPKMKRLPGRPYAHTYYVDGGINVRDAFVNGAWRTVLVGSLGAGGRGLYALDVTHPGLVSETSATGDAKKIMWEVRAENTPGDPEAGADPDVGYIFDATTITQLNDGKWYAVFGNGIGSANGEAILMMKELRNDGTSPAPIKISTGSIGDNGLSAPALVDTNNDGKADIAWAGDIKGDLWRFNLTAAGGTLAYKVYDGDPSQPITTAPDVTKHPQFGHLVLFGTGKLYEEKDLLTESTQALYGIWDTGSQPTYAEPLLDQLLSLNTTYDRFGFNERVRTYTTTVTVDYAIYKGWRVELYPGERMLTPPQLRAGRLKTTIYNPIDTTNWLLEAVFLDGNMAEEAIFNLNQDTALDELDRVNGNGNVNLDNSPDYSDPEDIPMAWKRPNGNMSQPTIASLAPGVDTMFLNFLNPPIVETAVVPGGCTGSCTGGLEGGHIDLDHDTVLGGDTDDHTHEYDDDVNRTYIDYLDISAGGALIQRNVTEAMDNNVDFIPLIANADFSKGGTLKISRNGSTDDLEYNVVEYQKMIHEKLATWDGASALLDPNGRSLIFKLNNVDDFRISFNSLVLITGGLHPTNTGCVRGNEFPATGRWRNGSLTMQLVKASHFAGLAAGESALDRLVVQTPVDFQEAVYLPPNYNGVALTADLDGNGTIDGTSPAYEIYGGLHADPALGNANNGFLYESTMFWHFDGVNCYGQPGWATEYFEFSQNSVYEIFYERLDRSGATTLDELAALVDGLIAEGCAVEGGVTSGDKDTKDSEPVVEDPDSCQAEYDELAETLALGRLIEANGTTINCGSEGCLGDASGGGSGDGGSGTSLSGDPLAIVGGIDEGGITSGPNFEAGRRTWIDILPQ
jgi:hypothetical protein